jgi:hemerythrin
MIKWSADYCLGVEEMDAQHQQLVAIAEKAYGVLKDSLRVDKYDEIVSIIEELKEYTLFHFKAEEEYMMSIKHPKFLSHKVQHNDFIEKVSKIDLKAVDANQEQYLVEILDFVSNWVINHIMVTDRLYVTK